MSLLSTPAGRRREENRGGRGGGREAAGHTIAVFSVAGHPCHAARFLLPALQRLRTDLDVQRGVEHHDESEYERAEEHPKGVVHRGLAPTEDKGKLQGGALDLPAHAAAGTEVSTLVAAAGAGSAFSGLCLDLRRPQLGKAFYSDRSIQKQSR